MDSGVILVSFCEFILNVTLFGGVWFCCCKVLRQWTLLRAHVFLFLFFETFFRACVKGRGSSTRLLLHRLGRCVRMNTQGIMSGTMEDLVQSVTSLKSTKGRITRLCCEKIVFSPLWRQLFHWNRRFLPQFTVWIENFHHVVDTWPPAS